MLARRDERATAAVRLSPARSDQALVGDISSNQPFEGRPRGSCASGFLSLSPVRTETVLSRRRKESPHESTYAHDCRECSNQLATSSRHDRKEPRRADDAHSAVTRSRRAARILACLLGPFGFGTRAGAPRMSVLRRTDAASRDTLRALLEAVVAERVRGEDPSREYQVSRAEGGPAGAEGARETPTSADERLEIARPGRFELPTPGSVDRCSIQLSYGRLKKGATHSTCALGVVQPGERPPRGFCFTKPYLDRSAGGWRRARTLGASRSRLGLCRSARSRILSATFSDCGP